MSYMAVFGGINLARVWESQVDISEYGTRTTRAHNQFYIDVMFAPAIRVRDMEVEGTTYSLIDNNHFGKQNLGWRVGWAGKPDYKNFTWGTEFGNRPNIYKTDATGAKAAGEVNRGVFWNLWMILPVFTR